MIGNGVVGIPEINPVGIQSGAERAARISWRGRYEETLEARLPEDARVGHTVERDAAAEAEIAQSRFTLQVPRDVHQHVLEHALNARRDVREPPSLGRLEIDRIVAVARRPEQVD